MEREKKEEETQTTKVDRGKRSSFVAGGSIVDCDIDSRDRG